jgi:hypothetical protein
LQDLLLQKAERVMVKLSPMLDISKALETLRHVKEVHVVAVANECKELDFILERDYQGEAQFVCVNLLSDQQEVRFVQEEERNCSCSIADGVLNYLYEPNPALMKAGCFKLLTERYNVHKLHKNSNLYTSEQLISDFPGRIFEVERWAHFNKKLKQNLLPDVDKASIAVRNFPLSVAELRKALKIGDGDAVYLFATTLKGEEKVVIRTKKAASIEAAVLDSYSKMRLSPIGDAELGPPSLVILCFDSFFDGLCPVFQCVEGNMGFIALFAEFFMKFVDFGRNGFQTLAVFLHFLHYAFFHAGIASEALVAFYSGNDEF